MLNDPNSEGSSSQPTETNDQSTNDPINKGKFPDEQVNMPKEDVNAARVEKAKELFYSEGPKEKFSQALDLFESAAVNGSTEAQAYLGIMYLKGLGTTQDIPNGLAWLEVAANKGHPEAIMTLANILSTGKFNVQRDIPRAEALFKKALTLKPDKASFSLAQHYAENLIPKDVLSLLKTAADNGHEKAVSILERIENLDVKAYLREADSLIASLSVEDSTYQKAAKYLYAAYLKGSPEAMFKISELCYMGWGVEKNPSLSLEWLNLACDNGYPLAIFYLSQFYLLGEVVEQDFGKAEALLEMDDNLNEPSCTFGLAKFYIHFQRIDEAKVLLKKAIRLGVNKAETLLQYLEEHPFE